MAIFLVCFPILGKMAKFCHHITILHGVAGDSQNYRPIVTSLLAREGRPNRVLMLEAKLRALMLDEVFPRGLTVMSQRAIF